MGHISPSRLKPYLDQVELAIGEQGIRLDASALNQALGDKRMADPPNALADLLDLDRYAGSFLSSTNWEALLKGSRCWGYGECSNEEWREVA